MTDTPDDEMLIGAVTLLLGDRNEKDRKHIVQKALGMHCVTQREQDTITEYLVIATNYHQAVLDLADGSTPLGVLMQNKINNYILNANSRMRTVLGIAAPFYPGTNITGGNVPLLVRKLK